MTSTLKLGSKIPISEIEGDISEASGISGFLDDDLTKLSQTGKEAVFNGITVDLSSSVSISNNGAMPFDGWALLRASVWGGTVLNTNNWIQGYINNKLIVDANIGYIQNGEGLSNSDSAFIPVKAGDVFKSVIQSEGNNAKACSCILYPYKNQQEEATE